MFRFECSFSLLFMKIDLADVLIIHIFEDGSVNSLVEKLIKDIC